MSETIKIDIEFRTRYQASIRYGAMKLAWQLGLTFSVQAFSACVGKPVTFNMRRVLKEMAAAEELYSYLATAPLSGRLQRYYCSQKSAAQRTKAVV